MNIQPPQPTAGLIRVGWVVVTWSWRPTRPGGQVVPIQTKGAIIFDDMNDAQEWMNKQHAAGNEGYKFDVFCGDPTYSGAGPKDWDQSVAHVFDGGVL